MPSPTRVTLDHGFLARFKRSPIYSLILGLISLGLTGYEWSSGQVYYRGRHYAGNWDFYFLLAFFGFCGLGLTVIGIRGLFRPSQDDDD